MENQRCEGSRQGSLDFKCKKILPDVGKSACSDAPIKKVDCKQDLEDTKIGTPTPPQTVHPSRIEQKGASMPLKAAKHISEHFQTAHADRKLEIESTRQITDKNASMPDVPEINLEKLRNSIGIDSTELPDEYIVIADLFDRMETSIRLLALRKKLPTFHNISVQVEILTTRKFSYHHLAQMKYTYPEAVQFEKILLHDKCTLCMKPELVISLIPDVVEIGSNESLSLALRQAFRSRLLDFFKFHGKNHNVPEALLPEPFNQKFIISGEVPIQPALPRTVIIRPESLLGCKDVSISESTRRHYYGQRDDFVKGTVLQMHDPTSPFRLAVESETFVKPSHLPSTFHEHFTQKIYPERENAHSFASACLIPETGDTITNQDNKILLKNISSCDSTVIGSFEGLISSPNRYADGSITNATPEKLALTPVVETPKLQVSKRPIPTPNDPTDSATPVSVYSATKRSLNFFASLEVPTYAADELAGSTEQNQVKKALGEVDEDPVRSQTGSEKRGQMLASLLDLVSVVKLIFQNANFSSITKQELVHKIIWHSCDITDTRDVEEQLEMLERFVPDWICRKVSSSGDCFYCIKRASDPVSIREKIVESF